MKYPKTLFGTGTVAAVVVTAVVVMVFLPNLHATPYASGLTNDAGTISFILNESGGNVTVSYEDGTTNANFNGVTTGTNLASGKYSFSLGGHTSYHIAVFGVGVGSPNQISDDSSNTVHFPSVRGVAVNANPGSPYFGLIYALNSTPGGSGDAYKQRGIYILNADTSDAFGRGTNASGAVFTNASSSSPYRVSVGPDDTVYVGDFSTAAATVWKFDPSVSDPSQWTNVLAIIGENAGIAAGIHGDISGAPRVTGSLAEGNLVLYTADAALGPVYNSIYRYDIGAGPLPWSNAPVQLGNCGLGGIAELNTDVALGPDGKIFGNLNRLNWASPNVTEWDTDGTNVLWDSLSAAGGTINNGPDLLQNTRSISVSPDGRYLAAIDTHNKVSVLQLTNGVPDASTLFSFTFGPTTGNARQIAWDVADNIYTVSSGQGLLRVYSLGATTTAITSNDSTGTNGTFTLTFPATKVSVEATVALASQSGPTPGVFTLTRSSDNPGDLTQAATVNYALSGTAADTSYTVSGGTATSVTFAPGQTTTNVVITPINDGVSRPTTTVILTLNGGSSYTTITPSTATIDIQNTGPQLLFISSVPAASMYNAFSNDYAAITITRWGDTNVAAYTLDNFTVSGTAVEGTDYAPPTPVTFNPGDIANTTYIYPLINGQPPVHTTNLVYTGNKAIEVGLGAGTGYTPGTNTATVTILDSAYPPTTVLYADPLTDPADAANWNVTAANNNMPTASPDYTVNFGYDLQNGDPYSPIPLPPSGATTALRVTVNKNSIEGSGASSGVNLYPVGKSFSGNYAVRFSMNIIEGYNPSYTTEGPLFGINHSGAQTNWWSGNAIVGTITEWASDGVWYWVSVDGGAALGDYIGFTGNGGALPNTGWQLIGSKSSTAFASVFKTNVFTSTGGPGLVGNNSVEGTGDESVADNWADVEIKQINDVVTLSINKTPIIVYANTTSFTSGTLMLGYEDPFSSVGTTDAAVYFSNLRVVRVGPPEISEIALNNANNTVVINFTSVDGDVSASSFALESASEVNGPYSDVASATFTQLGTAAFQVVAPQDGSTQFYRIRQK